MTDTDRPPEPPPEAEPAEPQRDGPMGAMGGTDQAALGIDATQRLDPPQADVDAAEETVPRREEVPRTAERPWSTTLAATGADAGVQSDVEDADDDERGRTASV